MTAPHPIACRCGAVQGQVAHPGRGTRAVCYCRDCQAFARFLGEPPGMMDALGGTDIVAIPATEVSFTRGHDLLACMSLSPRGTLRWYSACCRTPIGNTPRNPRVPHVGLVHDALEAGGGDINASFGPVRMRVNTESARGRAPANSPLVFGLGVASYLGRMAVARVAGGPNPFFRPGEAGPMVAPHLVTKEEREKLRAGA